MCHRTASTVMLHSDLFFFFLIGSCFIFILSCFSFLWQEKEWARQEKEENLTDYLIALEENLDAVPDYTSAPLMYISNNINIKSDICALDVFSCFHVWWCCCICREQPELPLVLSKERREEWAASMLGLTAWFRKVCLAFHSSFFILLALTAIIVCSSHLQSGYASELQK